MGGTMTSPDDHLDQIKQVSSEFDIRSSRPDRRTFLRRAGLVLGGSAAAAMFGTACSSADTADTDPNDAFDFDGISSTADPVDMDPNDSSDLDT